MTRDEVAKLVVMALANYPSQQEKTMKPTAELWFQLLGDLEFPLAQAAVTKVLVTAKFWPTVAEVREAALSLLPTEIPAAELAWGEVVKAVAKVGRNGTPQWSHPVIGQAVEVMWGSWVHACQNMPDGGGSTERAQFLKIYANLTKRDREDALLPPSVKQLTQSLTGKLRLPDGG